MSARIPIWSRVVFLALLPFVIYSAWDYVEARRLQSRLDAIQQRGESLELRRISPRGDALRAETLYRAAAVLATLRTASPRSVADSNRLGTLWRTGRWTPETLALARADVEAGREALQLADRAADLPFVNFLTGASYNFLIGDLVISLSRLMELRAAVAVSDGKGETALASFYSEAQLARALDVSPESMTPSGVFLPSFRGLGAAVSAAEASPARERLAMAFSALDRDDRLKQALITGRAMMVSGGSELSFARVGRYPPNPFVARIATNQLDAFAALIAVADAPWPQRIEAVNAVDVWPFGFAGGRNAHTTFALRSFTKSIVAQVKQIRCARLIVSPTALTLIDPFTGKPLERSQCQL